MTFAQAIEEIIEFETQDDAIFSEEEIEDIRANVIAIAKFTEASCRMIVAGLTDDEIKQEWAKVGVNKWGEGQQEFLNIFRDNLAS